MSERHTIGIVGARGYTGAELVRLIRNHPSLDLIFAGSRELAGQRVPGSEAITYESTLPNDLSVGPADIVVLALPDGASHPYVEAVGESTVIVDLSADHRLDDAWAYGLPELFREKLKGAVRIANPGCYATVMQLALAPLADGFDGVPALFGVSGYSGAGATPGPRNDPERLRDNLMPYALVGHKHEKETVHHLGLQVRFMPHVHPAFRGLLVTAHVPLAEVMTTREVLERFEERYAGEALIEVQGEIPELSDGTGRLGVLIGGFETSADGRNAVVVAAEDNLLKGAAVQAMQNVNLAVGLPELEGLVQTP